MKNLILIAWAILLILPAIAQAHDLEGYQKANMNNFDLFGKINAVNGEFAKAVAQQPAPAKGENAKKVEMSFGQVYFLKKSGSCQQLMVYVNKKLGSQKPFHWHAMSCKNGDVITIETLNM